MNVALIVEGDGDHRAFPTLIAKTGLMLGENYYANNPVMGGTAEKLARDGKLEAALRMAASRRGTDLILVAVDLDDGCPVAYQADFQSRAAAMEDEIKVPVRFTFCIREYEAWFLEAIDSLRDAAPEFGWLDGFVCNDPTARRDAKGVLREAMSKHYKPSAHQLRLTQACDLKILYAKSRSYRKLVKSLADVDYDLLSGYFD